MKVQNDKNIFFLSNSNEEGKGSKNKAKTTANERAKEKKKPNKFQKRFPLKQQNLKSMRIKSFTVDSKIRFYIPRSILRKSKTKMFRRDGGRKSNYFKIKKAFRAHHLRTACSFFKFKPKRKRRENVKSVKKKKNRYEVRKILGTLFLNAFHRAKLTFLFSRLKKSSLSCNKTLKVKRKAIFEIPGIMRKILKVETEIIIKENAADEILFFFFF